MPRWIAILLLFIITGQAVQPAFAGNCCSADAELTCGMSMDEASEIPSCCKTTPEKQTTDSQPEDEKPHDCGDDCECSCCLHVVFSIPLVFHFQSIDYSFPELNIMDSDYSFHISFSVFQPPRLG